ncbi:MAG TPA: nucleotidyltransferase domain-containing protein [Bryobacteraceae bacterium]|nr:nucleotidyltransferase domain-containing protein [Bryobacteraceae bacterium]
MLQSGGVLHLHLFGSYARGTAIQDVSDVDLMADFDSAKKLTILNKAGLEVELREMLRTPVDLSDRAMLKEPVRLNAELRDILDAIESLGQSGLYLAHDRPFI